MIHLWSVIHSDVEIGEGTDIWQFASVIRGTTIGRDCSIGAYAVLDGVTLGDGCRVGCHASIHPGAVLGNNVFVGPGAVICNDVWPHVSKEGFEVASPTVRVDDGASIGAGAVILPGVRIGEEALVAANATVSRDVPPGMVVMRDGELMQKPADWTERRVRTAC